MRYNLLVVLCLALSVMGCNIDQAALDACDLEEIKASNTISDECRQSLQNALPSPEDNLTDLRIPLGQTKIATNPILFILGANAGSNIVVKSGVTTLMSSDYLIKPFTDYSGTLVSTSMLLDYSGSMSDMDITQSIGIYDGFFEVLNGSFESEIRLFSTTVVQKQNFTSNYNTLISNISKDDAFPRGSTALYDAIGSGLSALAARVSPMQLLMVTTDGLENASFSYDKDSVISLASSHNIPIVIMGTLFSDVGPMKSLANSTNGIFIYVKNLEDLAAKGVELKNMLSEIKAIEVTNPNYANSAFSVTVDDVGMSFPAQ